MKVKVTVNVEEDSKPTEPKENTFEKIIRFIKAIFKK